MDRVISDEAVRLVRTSGLRPTLVFHNGRDHSAHERMGQNRTGGISISRSAIAGLSNAEIKAIVRHEFGHIIQYASSPRVGSPLSEVECELNADFLSGYLSENEDAIRTSVDAHIALIRRSQPVSSNYDEGTHGRAIQRETAVAWGYQLRGVSPDSARRAGDAIVKGIVDRRGVPPQDGDHKVLPSIRLTGQADVYRTPLDRAGARGPRTFCHAIGYESPGDRPIYIIVRREFYVIRFGVAETLSIREQRSVLLPGEARLFVDGVQSVEDGAIEVAVTPVVANEPFPEASVSGDKIQLVDEDLREVVVGEPCEGDPLVGEVLSAGW